MRRLRTWSIAALFTLAAGTALAAPMTLAQARQAVAQADADARLAGVERLAEIGTGADAERLYGRLSDDAPAVRAAAEGALWQLWSRSGDRAIDRLYARGIEQMKASAHDAALATFSEIVRRKPGFTEGWNKRATLYFLLGRNEQSLKDCDEVLKRNPRHFGALSGAGQIHLQLGHAEQALDFFRRALEVNPNLDGMAEIIPALEQVVREKSRHTT